MIGLSTEHFAYRKVGFFKLSSQISIGSSGIGGSSKGFYGSKKASVFLGPTQDSLQSSGQTR
jgi:hypothetical protein